MEKLSVFWFRRDLRLEDNAGLYHALKGRSPVIPLFIFDTNILDKLSDRSDARVNFIWNEIRRIKQELKSISSDLIVRIGAPLEIFKELTILYNLQAVYTNHDFESYGIERDHLVNDYLKEQNIGFYTYKDHVIFEKEEVVKDDGKPYTVFTPYAKKWKIKLNSKIDKQDNQLSYYLKSYPSEKYFDNFKKFKSDQLPTLKSLGFCYTTIELPGTVVQSSLIKNYEANRNFPAIQGTSKLGIHFRFGTISIREKARKAMPLSETFINELIWRDFYAQILYHFPYVEKGPFRQEYDRIEWINNPKDFEKWCEGKTGYPIVDAGMRELNATGFMHNRVRMITASFLTKHLLIDWRWGEQYFAEKLLDFDLASNNGGWQWAAGCGTDAAPYFRIFSPDAQTTKFDKDKIYIKQWVPDYNSTTYPKPMVDHSFARTRCLEIYKTALKSF